MLVVSLWGVNCRFWSHLGCLGWKVTVSANSLTPHKSPLGEGAGLIGIFRQASPSLLYGSPPGLLGRTTETSSTVTGSNFFPPRVNVLRFSNHHDDKKNRIPILSKWFAIMTSRLLCQMLANLGPIYMEVGDPRKVR